jgi:hypothetical protein
MTSTDTCVPPPSRPRRRLGRPRGAAAALAAAGLAAVAGCSSAGAPAAASGSAAPASPAAATSPAVTSPAGATSTPTASARPAASTPPPAAPAGPPTLGQAAGVLAHGRGFGQVRPPEIFNGGDPTGLVTKITWQSWGGATATGTGTSTYVGPGQSVAAGTQQRATVVAFQLGTCQGKLMYRAVEWFFPQHGQSFTTTRYENICTGTFAGAS